MQTQDYIVDEQGNFRFTSTGLDSLAPLLAKAGIDAKHIKTYAEYIQARKAASPYFMEYLQEETEKRLKGKPDTLGSRAVRSIVFGSPEEQDELLEKLKRRRKFKTV